MENLEAAKVSVEGVSSEHLNANKVYFATEVLNNSNVMPIYSKLCMVLDIYDVKHEIVEDPTTHTCKALKPAWLANNGKMADHVECLVRYIGNKRVLMTNCAEYDPEVAAALKEKFEADGYEVVELSYSSCNGVRNAKDMSWAYINYIQTSKVVIVPMQRAEEDKEALQQIKACFPDLAVVGVYAKPFFGDEGEFLCYSKSINENSIS
ncbi:agmatine deiminase family protein [Prevotella falsenii]|uniref:agmatine deiminase family protein n=1 Tax=Prevotella falsenii TaxID=515414 RepID=UPI0004696EB7|nr:agmatine deiminase family protein [Prevotella falsenii]